jgi:tRNA wybutosine-synthesizing protein 2
MTPPEDARDAATPKAGAGDALAILVAKPATDAAMTSLRAEGVYDADRSLREWDDDNVAIPVTAAPADTDHRGMVRDLQTPRRRTLEDLLCERGWSDADIERAPGSWAVIGDVVLVDVDDAPRPGEVGEALLDLHGGADTVLAREGIEGLHREPSGRVIAGDGDTETVHREHGTAYAMDLAEVMFSPGNKAERVRMGETTGPGERVLDAFAGIGYFALPMARAGASVTAIEHNPTALRFLLENARLNEVTDNIQPYRGDCREVAPTLAAEPFDRLVMGYYDAHEYLDALLPALSAGGVVHLHEATPEPLAPERPIERIEAAAADLGRAVEVCHTRRVKTHSEGVDHVVVDARVG